MQTRIQKMIDVLSLFPNIGAATSDPTILRLPIGPYPYLVFYEVTGDEVIVHAIRHAARDPAGMPGSA